MRIQAAAFLAALSLSASPALAAPDAPQPPPGGSLTFYPPAARDAHVEGEATIRCARNIHLALKGCTLVSETPAGQAFGAAALAMAAKSPDNPDVNATDLAQTAATSITVRFRLSSPQIDPDLTEMAHLVRRPQVSQQPSPQRLGFYYPAGEAEVGIHGSGTVHCRVARDGGLTACSVVKQTRRDFGLAAVRVAEREYRMTPLLVDGKPTDQGEADLTIAFEPLHAPASALPPEANAAPDIKAPLWLRLPTATDFAIAYPRAAQMDGRSGAALIKCVVDAEGHLDPCAVLAEKPAGQGFASAALDLVKRFQMQAKDRGGAPTAGRTIRLPVYFVGP